MTARAPGGVDPARQDPAAAGARQDGALSGRPVVVLGGGVAGLAVALALARRGARVRVLEQAPAITEVGAGLQISPNGARVLHALGLGPALAAAAMPAQAVELREGRSGALVTRLDLAARGAPGFHLVHRADLIALLERGARAAGVEIELGCRIVQVMLGAGQPRLLLDDGRDFAAPLLIGADGLHSRVRAALGQAESPFFTRQVAWRAVIPETPGAAPVAQVFMAPGRHLVSYPLRGGQARNIVAVEERIAWADEGWAQQDDPVHLRAAFAAMGGPVPGWLAQVQEVNLWGLFRHKVAPRWHDGAAAALLGDAGHPTLPFLAQGANMALEDAWVLAASLDAVSDTGAALAAYQAARAQRCQRIVAAADRNARAYHLSGPLRGIAHLGLRLADRLAPNAALGRFDWLYGHDVTRG